MSINYEIWGEPSTWLNSPIMGGQTGTLSEILKISNPKCPDFDTESNPTRLVSGITSGRITANEPLDLTICPCGQDEKVSAFGKLAIFNEDGALSTTPRVVERTSPVNWFMYDQRLDTDRQVAPFKIWKDWDWSTYNGMRYDQWSPSATTNYKNPNLYISPYTFWYTRSLLLSIQVACLNSASASGVDFTWRTLDDWKNNYSNQSICGIRCFTRGVNSYNTSTNTIEYINTGLSQYNFAGKVGLLDPIPDIKNNGVITDTTFYSFLHYGNSGRALYLFMPNSSISAGHGLAILPAWEMFDGQTINKVGNSSYGYTYYYSIPYSDDTYEKIMKMIACFGCYFTPSGKTSFPYAMTDSDLCLPIIDDNGIAHGEYTRGADNVNNDLYDLESIRDKEYDPTKPPAPTPSSDPMLPTSLSWSLASSGTGVWALTSSDIRVIWNDIFNDDIKLKNFGNEPLNAILSLEWTPFKWGPELESPIVLGSTDVNPIHIYPIINSPSEAEAHGYGTMKFQFDKNFYNARYMQARLFLPFYGYYELPAAQLLSSELRIDFYYNIPDELGVYIISYDNVIYDYAECDCKIEIPLTGSHAAAIKANKRSEALTIATQVASLVATTVSAGVGAWGSFNIAAGLGAGASAGAIPVLGEQGAAAWGSQLAGMTKTLGFVSQGAKAASGAINGGVNIANTVHNARAERAALKTNLPYHGSALQTTFLHMSMKPYVQIFKNAIMVGLDRSSNGVDQTLSGNTEAQYKLKVGHACDVWTTISAMPENSLLQATGIADSTVVNMELSEVQELNGILQSGFFK